MKRMNINESCNQLLQLINWSLPVFFCRHIVRLNKYLSRNKDPQTDINNLNISVMALLTFVDF